MFFTNQKVRKHVDEIRSLIYREVQEIPEFKYLEEECEEAYLPGFDDTGWRDFHVGEDWGGYDKVAWFRTNVKIPSDWKDRKLVLRFLVGPRDGGNSTAETLLYVNGRPLQAIDIWHEEAWVPPELIDTGEIHIALKAWSGVLGVPDQRRFKVAQLACVDEASEQYYYLADTLLKAIEELDENDLRRTEMLRALNESIKKVDFLKPGSDIYYDSVRKAADDLQGKLSEMSEVEEIKPKVVALGHSHIDMAWLWRLSHTREKASRTFSTVLHLMRQYPDYRYLHSSPQLYQFMKADYPEIYENVKKKIESGEWEITGGMWVEPDTNLPSGESLIRQLLFGKRFMKEEFGVESKVVWLPDVFGFTWSLPQIMKKSGIDSFMTTKISWNQFNRFPYDTFNWRGIDGTEILSHFITTPEFGSPPYTYNGEIDPKSVKGIWDLYRQKEVNHELLLAYGWGDGGGGPTKEMLEARRVMKNLPGFPKLETGKAEPYFERLEKRLADKELPVWDGELYLEFHRGTYTSQASLKRANRKAEVIYHQAEWLSVIASLLRGGTNHSNEKLREGWERLLLNQFHDVLPGSSIRQVNEDARADYIWVQQLGQEVLDEANQSIFDAIRTDSNGVVVFNSLAFNRNDLIELPHSDQFLKNQSVFDEQGRSSPVQVIDDGNDKKVLLKAENVPPLGYKTFRFAEANHDIEPSIVVHQDYLENQFYKIRLNDKGQFMSIYDKRTQREVLEEGASGNVFQAFEDKPMDFDAWDIDLYYQEKMREITKLVDVCVLEEGPLRGTLRLKWLFYDSEIRQDLTIYSDSPRIDFKTRVDWQERQTLLKVAFPVDIRSTKANYDIQFGNIERPTHWNTSWDYARFEAVGQKWVDLSEGNYGVSLLNDCKYGHDVKDNVMRLTLIKSAIEPDETADRGTHLFTYSLLPHKGDWRNGGVVEEAYNLNQPLLAREISSCKDGSLPSEYQFVEVDADHVMIETVKKAEEDDAVVVRLYENKQYRNQEVNLSFSQPIVKAVECNLIEEEAIEADYDRKNLSFAITPYEIKTFKIWFE
ncbi:MAG TPA: alpha-mannosidase [Bacillales bacterium]|nr:alpha-mannosidase [Bacillales bacterium]